MRRLLAAAALLLAAGAGAQTGTTEAQARIYVWSALMTGAAHAIVSQQLELAPLLRERLLLPPSAGSAEIYEALVGFTRGRLIRVRPAQPAEMAPLDGRARDHPVFVVEGGATALLVAYDLQNDKVALVALAGAPWSEPEPVAAAPSVPVDLGQKSFLLKPIYFEYGEAALTEEAIARLNDAGLPKLAALPDVRYVIRGHSDRLEAAEHKRRLSEQRAEAVRDYLAKMGVASQNIAVYGFGSSISLTACAQRDRAVLVFCLEGDRRATVEVVPPL
jgi:outer membrane protein OmpA-like peptidoglycan-associated protein